MSVAARRPDITELARLIDERGPFAPAENRALFERRFSGGPSRRLRTAIARYGVDHKRVLDLGCSYGEYLIYFGAGSVGLDVQDRCVAFARALGLEAYQCDLESDPLPVPRRHFDAIWCSNLLEHVTSPHRFLLKVREHLHEDGLLFLVVPTFPENGLVRRAIQRFAPAHWQGIFAADHVNGFTRQTLPFMVERSGYRVEETLIYVSPNRLVNALANAALRRSWVSMACVARPDFAWRYPDKAHKQIVNGEVTVRR